MIPDLPDLATVAARMRNAAGRAPYQPDSAAAEYWRGYRTAALEAADALDELVSLHKRRGE